MTGQADHELVRAAQSGDRAAFARLAERHYKLMFKVAWQWCGRREDAEDIAQEAAIKLAQYIGDFRGESSFTTWLYRLTINAAKDYYKAKNRRDAQEQPIYEDVQYASHAPSPEEQLVQKDVLKAIALLPEDLKDTVILVCWHGLSHKQAAEILECPEGTVSWRVHEARKKIAGRLERAEKGKSHG
jgi:RNA polymerase sigma-70 factor, ECF subfamily